MKLSNDLIKDIQLARLYRALSVIVELTSIYAVVWGIHTALTTIASWM